MDELVGRSILVSGNVQGVFYRASTVEKAVNLGLRGWVKNLPSGQVLIEAFGSLPAIEKLIDWCRQGPPSASVSNLKIDKILFEKYDYFKVEY